MNPRKPPSLPPEDAALWAYVTHDVTPITGKTRPKTPISDDTLPDTAAVTPKARPTRPHTLPHLANMSDDKVVTPKDGVGIDRNTRTKLERGQMQIEAILDLHGNNYDVAQARFQTFIKQGWAAGLRCVLVITGKGSGILKSGFQDWVSTAPIKSQILHVYPAQGKHGGGGAFYVLLRRKR